jgi:hypothetical protein
MSDKAIEGRMRRAGDWLDHILARLLAARTGQTRPVGPLTVSVIDSSVICSPGSKACPCEGGGRRLAPTCPI